MLASIGPGCAHHGGAAPKADTPANPAPAAAEPAPRTEPPADAPRPVMEAQALERLRQMSDTLASAGSFTFRSRSMAEVPASTGQHLTVFTEAEIAVQRPNKLRARIGGDIPSFQIIYDGSQVSALDPEKALYAQAKAPATIDDTLKFLMDKSGIHFPSSDVLLSDPYAVMAKDIVSAFRVGPSTVDGFRCDHLAFMGPGVNWEIWIDAGKQALPRRLAVTYKEVTNFPRFLLEFSDWNLKPRLPAGTFAFKKPANAHPIDFAPRIDAEVRALEAPR
jgi:hypothetical protein